MNNVILDASALLALIKNETGAEIVENLLGKIIMSTINISEVATILLDIGMTNQECEQSIFPFISQIIHFDQKQALRVATLRKETKSKGLSLGDRACIALGIEMNLPIYTADKVWAELNIFQADIKVIR